MATLTGEYGVVEGVKGCREWQISEEATAEVIRNSATKGAAKRVNGVKRSTGSFTGEGGIPLKMPGEALAFKGYTAPDDGVFGSDGNTASVNTLITSVSINLNWAGNESVNHNVEFTGTGELTFADEFLEDVGPIPLGSICAVKIDYGLSGSEVVLENIATATLTFRKEVITYINSSTNCIESSKPGPLDWDLSITLQDNRRAIALQSDERFRVWINDTQFYLLEFGHVEAYNTLSTNPSTGDIITQEMMVVMQSIRQSDSQIGQIAMPDGSIYWPPAAPPAPFRNGSEPKKLTRTSTNPTPAE